jgi:hypothetical protein
MFAARPDPGKEQREVELLEGVRGIWDCKSSGERTPIDVEMFMERRGGREGGILRRAKFGSHWTR